MTLGIGEPGRRFFSQRIDGRPFVNCLPYSICPVLAWQGYQVPADYGMQLREASGVPVAAGRGTSHANMRRALHRILPSSPITFAGVTDGQLINLLPRRKKPNQGSVISIICRMERLPRHLRRHCGYTFEGLHGLTLYQRRRAPDGTWLVYLTDPMGRTWRGYSGEWVAMGDLTPALKRDASGLIRIIHGARGTAV